MKLIKILDRTVSYSSVTSYLCLKNEHFFERLSERLVEKMYLNILSQLNLSDDRTYLKELNRIMLEAFTCCGNIVEDSGHCLKCGKMYDYDLGMEAFDTYLEQNNLIIEVIEK